MPLDTAEAIQAAWGEVAIAQDILAKVKAMPPKEARKWVDIAPVLGLDPNGSLYKQLAMVDQIAADIKD